MDKQNLIYEIGVEEIPSQYVATMAASFLDNAGKLFAELRLASDKMEVFYTPRRLVLRVHNLASEQPQQNLTMKGPARKIAFDQDGKPSRALQGFLNKNHKTAEDISFVSDGKAEYVTIEVVIPGQKTVDVLKDALAKLITLIYNPNPMRWGSYKTKFIRPIRWLLALFGAEIIPVEIECCTASNLTHGHRTLADREIPVACADDYMAAMEKAFVVVDQNARKQLIVDQIHALEQEKGFRAEIDESLLDEVSNIVEYPTCAVGRFDEKYLSLPECIIKDPLKNQQRYFPVYIDGKITNAFVYARNGGSDFIDNVTRGNERVLRPRLEDAEFFYNNDLKTSIRDKAADLAKVMYVDNGGSYADKAARVEAIALRFAAHVGYQETDLIKQAAPILKADLVSAVVREYTDTQGLVGGVFARNEGYDERIATAISEQYLPNFYGDRLPSQPLSAIMSIADKLDSVMCLSAVGLKPSGSADPYGLRRQILGIYNIMLEMDFDLDLDQFLVECADLYAGSLETQGESKEHFIGFLKDYLYQRLRIFLHEEKKFSFDTLDKITVADLNVHKCVKKASTFNAICNDQWYLDFIQIFNRIVKLVNSSKDEAGAFNASIADEAAAPMFQAFFDARAAVLQDIDAEDYEAAIQKIAGIGKSINAFMQDNIALCDDAAMRRNRLAFFQDFCQICGKIIHI